MNSPRLSAAPHPVWLRARCGPPLVIVLLVLLCFSPVLHNDFVNWDDDANFLDNPHYRGLSPSHLAWMFTTFHWGHYHPLSWVAHGLVYAIWGANPFGYHLISLVFHAANAVAFYYLILALLGGVERKGDSPPQRGQSPFSASSVSAAVVGALLFALHPLRVEAVAWATDLHEVLSTFFSLLMLLAYLRMEQHAAGQPRRWYVLSVGCFALSLLSKATAITLPVVLLVLDVYPLRRLRLGKGATRVPFLLEKLPYAVLAIAAAALAMLAKEDRGLIVLSNHGVVARVMQSAYGLCFYLWKTVAPLSLSPLYLLRPPLDPTEARYLLSALAVVALSGGLFLLRRRYPWALTAWCCYVLMALPMLGLLQNGPQITADRYTYLACLPWAVLVAAGIDWLWAPAPRPAAPARVAAAVAIGVLLPLLGVRTYEQTRVWADSLTLWNHALATDPTNHVAYANRGNARLAKADVSGALADFDSALRFNPQSVLAYANRANALLAKGDVAGALADSDAALRLNPQLVDIYVNRGNARQAKGDLDGALADFTEVLRRRPQYAKAYINRGTVRQAKGDLDGALADYNAGLRIDPQLAAAYYRRGNVYRAKGDLAAALADYSQSLRLDPTAAHAYNNRAIAREAQGDLAGAFADYSAALRLMPDSGPFQRNVARARQLLAEEGR